jgi:MFS family permease
MVLLTTSHYDKSTVLRCSLQPTDQGVFSGILQNENWLQQFGHPSEVITGITVSSYCLGALTGCIMNFFIGDILGRRKMIWLSMAFVFLGASLQTSAYSLGHLIAGRFITGVGTGLDSSTVYAPPSDWSSFPILMLTNTDPCTSQD